jgi:hypothetical protein
MNQQSKSISSTSTSANSLTFDSYWNSYVAAHPSGVSRVCHAAGVALGLSFALSLVLSGMFFFLPLAVVVADLGARLGHRLTPRSSSWRPGDHPVWAALADLKMSALFMAGRQDLSSPRGGAA